MSLSKRLITVISGLFVLVFIGTFAISVNNIRNYLNKQLQISSQDTATSLAKSISDSLINNDTEKLKSIVDAVFDRGYYSLIDVRKVDGTSYIKRVTENKSIKGVPGWFVKFISLNTPIGKQDIISLSFKRMGTIVVSAHPGIAYHELWQNFTENFWWLCLVGIMAFSSVFFLIRLLLNPLEGMERQANEIAKGNFVIQDVIPSTPELRNVAVTMNKMSTKVSQMLEAQTELTEQMRKRAYQDSVTGLQNRRHFAEQMDHLIKNPEEFDNGSLMLFEISEFKEYNQTYGYLKADELLVKIAQILKRCAANYVNTTIARVGGASFAILTPNLNLSEVKVQAKKLQGEFEQLHEKGKIDDIATVHVGIAFFDGNQDSTELLSMADMALRAAQVKGPNRWHIYDEHNVAHEQILSASAWRELLKDALENKSFELHYQPVKRIKQNDIIHYEVLLRMHSVEGKLVPAGSFLPMAQRLGLGTGIDLFVVETLIESMGDENQERYAVNLCSASIQDEKFIEWLEGLLKKYPQRAHRIIFEMREYSAAMRIDDIRETIHRLRENGCAFSLDHFGTGSPDFGYLLNTKIDYIKIDGGYIHNIEGNDDNKFFLKSIVEIAHGLDIEVIGEYVETEVEYHTIKTLNLDGAQGHYIGKPHPEIAAPNKVDETVNQ